MVSGGRQAGHGGDRRGRAASDLLDGAGWGRLGPGLAEPWRAGSAYRSLEVGGMEVGAAGGPVLQPPCYCGA